MVGMSTIKTLLKKLLRSLIQDCLEYLCVGVAELCELEWIDVSEFK